MNRKTLLGRFASSLTASKAVRPDYTSVKLEPLEDRKMLAATTFVNDDWVNVSNFGNPVQEGDTVAALNDGDANEYIYGTTAFGIVDGTSLAQFATIYSAIQNTSTNGVLTLMPGTFKESDIVIDHPMTLKGTLVGGNQASVIVPEIISANVQSEFGADTHSGIIIYSPTVTVQDVKVDGSGNGAIGSSYDFHQGITTLYQNGGQYSSIRNGLLTPIILGAAGSGETDGGDAMIPRLNQSMPVLDINNVNVTNVYWHGVTISPLFNRTFDTGQEENFNLQVRNSTISNVGDVKDANRIGVLLQNLTDEKDSQGNAAQLNISNVGVGVKTQPYGDNNVYGNSNAASNQSYIRFVTVTDPVVNGIEVIDGSRGDAYGWVVKFNNPANNGTGISLNRSRSALIGAVVTGAKIGVHIQNSPFSIANTGNNDRHPQIAWDTYITGPGAGVAGSVGILVDSKVGDAHSSNTVIGEQLTITGFETGVKAEQTTAVGTGLKNTILFAGGRIYGNGTDISIGQNSVGNGRVDNAKGFAATKISVTGNGVWDPQMYNYDFREPYYLTNPGNSGTKIEATPNAEENNTGNFTFGSSATYAPYLTGESNSAPLFDFNNNATYAFSAPPDEPVDGVVPQPYGALFGWFGNVTQNDGTLTVGGSATNGYQYEFLFGAKNTPIVGGPNNGKYQLVGTDISDKTHLNVKIQLLPSNQNKTLEIGLLDFRGNVNMYTIDCTELSSTSYTVVSIPILAPSVDLTGPDSRLDLTNICGWVLGGDQGVANGLHNVPVGFKIDEITTSSVANSKLVVTGTVTLNGSKLDPHLLAGYTPTLNQTFTIIDNDGADAVSGTFAGLANGATVVVGSGNYQVNYNGGTGNDVVLTYKGTGGGPVTTIAGRNIFYNQSKFDGNSAAISPANDALAIAPKTAYIPGSGVAVAANMTSFSRGINGIMVDLSAGVNHTGITASDFTFKVGNNNAPAGWAAAPAPSAISVVPGGGVGGSDRVIITWASGSISNKWLEVQVKATANTGLAAADVHFWGNKVGDSASSSPAGLFETTSTDSAQVLGNIGGSKLISDLRDYNRDGQVSSTDSAIVLANVGNIVRLNVGAGGPFAPEADPAAAEDSGVAQALAATATPSGLPKLPGWLSSRLSSVDLNNGPIAKLFTQLAESNSPRANAVLAKAHEVADALGLDDSLLESLIDGRA